ncbi:hypothetical protein [Streptomyces brevispora]|uniref:hypothetical protein n=1 Tax=Streptomyces brevispora TaxID=887462 RepID=UPI0038161AFF
MATRTLPNMRHSLTKPRPAADEYTGALLLEQLAYLIPDGVRLRIDRPWRGLPNEYIVCERAGYARVWIHCAADVDARDADGYRLPDHYDIPQAKLWVVAAVVTDDESTRFVYDGFSAPDDMSARAQIVQCAEAVAVQLGVSPFCGSCEDTGTVTHYHHSTDGVTGWSECEWPPCVERRAKARAKYEAQEATRRVEEAAHTCADDLCCPPF